MHVAVLVFSADRRTKGHTSERKLRRRSKERRLVLAVAVSFGFVVVSWLISRTITELVSRRIEGEAESISKNALIASEELATTRTNVRKMIFEMDDLRARHPPDVRAQQLAELDMSRKDAADHWARYVAIPFYPGERELVENVQPDVESAELAVSDVSERMRRGDHEGALRVIDERALPAIERTDEGLARLVHLNVREAQKAATRILASNRPWGLVPEIIGAFFALAAAYFGIRLVVQYLAWAAERSAELEGFAGRVAHDIRSPLGSASLALEIAQREKGIDSSTRELLARVGRTMERIAKLVDGLLVFATTGGYFVPGAVSETRTNAADVLGGVVEDVKLEAETKHIEIDYQAPDPDLIVACSPGVLISIMTNLLSNAMKFMENQPVRRITIRTRQIRKDVEIGVSDTGPGIAPELRDKVFEPYFRGESRVAGLGLGLATVRKLVEAHGGTVGIESSSDGGCLFWFRVPGWTDRDGETAARRPAFELPHPA